MLCLAVFLFIQKPMFLLYNWDHGTSACSFGNLLDIYYHGFALDMASAGYLTVVPLLLVWARLLIPRFPLKSCIKVYNIVVAFGLALIITADAALYEFWEFKLDATVFMYIGDPKNAFASVSVVLCPVASADDSVLGSRHLVPAHASLQQARGQQPPPQMALGITDYDCTWRACLCSHSRNTHLAQYPLTRFLLEDDVSEPRCLESNV